MKRTVAILGTLALLSAGAWLVLESGTGDTSSEALLPQLLAPFGLSKGGDPEQARIAWAPYVEIEASGPSIVELSTIPAGIYDPDNQLDSGKIPGRIESPLPEAEVDRLRAEAAFLPPSENIQIMAPGGGELTAGTSFDSIDVTECCGGGAVVPPDPELAAGPNHLIAVVNLAFEIYNKSGTSLAGPTTFASFFTGTSGYPGGPFDPNVLYDEVADRWYLGIDAAATDFCFAVTQTPDPTGAWNRYCFPTDIGGAFFDYPHSGIGQQAIYMGSNQFGGTAGFEGRLFAIDKDAVYAGLAISVPSWSTGSDGTPQPGHLRGMTGTGPDYLMTDVFNGCEFNMWSIEDPFGTPVLTRGMELDFCTSTGVTGGFPLDWPQSGTGNLLQANDWRGRGMEYHDGNFYVTDTVSCNPGAGPVNCARWAIVDPLNAVTAPAGVPILDSGVVSSEGEHRTFPSIAVNACGDIALGYSKGSSSMFASTFVTGRQAGDPAGIMEPEQALKMGEIPYISFDGPPHRWGDYTGMYRDPDGATFWYLGEYAKNTASASADWGNYIGSFTFPDCPAGLVFADGFESGDTLAWDSTVPVP